MQIDRDQESEEKKGKFKSIIRPLNSWLDSLPTTSSQQQEKKHKKCIRAVEVSLADDAFIIVGAPPRRILEKWNYF